MEDNEQWDLLGFIISSQNRRKVINVLQKNPMTPTEISGLSNVSVNQVSNILKKLSSRNLVICRTPDRKKGRLYELTRDGKKIIDIINKIQK